MGWIAFGRFWRLDKHLLHIFTAFVMRKPSSVPGILESTSIYYKATITSSNNLSDCSGCLVIKQGGFFVSVCATALWFPLCCSAAVFCPNSCCLYLKKLYVPHFCLTMRKEPQVINKAFAEIVRFKHWGPFASISITSNGVSRVSIQKSRHLFLWGNCFKSITALWIGR